MKTKILLAAALIGAASLSAQAGVRFGFSFGLPVPLPVVVAAPTPIVAAPAVYVPSVAIATPACPGPDYIWVPGYWSVNGYNRVYIHGSWQHHPTRVAYAPARYGHRW